MRDSLQHACILILETQMRKVFEKKSQLYRYPRKSKQIIAGKIVREQHFLHSRLILIHRYPKLSQPNVVTGITKSQL